MTTSSGIPTPIVITAIILVLIVFLLFLIKKPSKSSLKSILFKSLSILIVFVLLIVFFLPFGGLNAYIIAQKKHDGLICQKSFCFEAATVSAFYSSGQETILHAYCDQHQTELRERVSSRSEVMLLTYYGSFIMIALSLIAMIYCIRRVFEGKHIYVLGVLAAALFTNFLPWITQVFS